MIPVSNSLLPQPAVSRYQHLRIDLVGGIAIDLAENPRFRNYEVLFFVKLALRALRDGRADWIVAHHLQRAKVAHGEFQHESVFHEAIREDLELAIGEFEHHSSPAYTV